MAARIDRLDRLFQRLMLGLAVFILVEPLLLVAVIVVAVQRPDSLWIVLAPYLLFTGAALSAGAHHLRKAGLLKLGPAAPALGWFALWFALCMAAFAGLVAIWPTFVPLWLVLLMAAFVALIAWLLRWQASRLAFRCDSCDATFAGTTSTWALSLNMGNHKQVRCPDCGEHWAEVIVRPVRDRAAD